MTPEEKSGLVLRLLSAKNLIAAVVELIEEVKADEREACAKIAEAQILVAPQGGIDTRRLWTNTAVATIAAAIRARP
jgi:putative intracellular protease/amidase